MALKIAKLLSNMKSSFSGFMIMVDNLPPYPLFFSIPPEVYNDDWEAEFEYVTSPGSRYQYPIFKGNSARSVDFELKMDASYPVQKVNQAIKIVNSKVGGISHPGLWKGTKYAHTVLSQIAFLEKAKLPKTGVATVLAGPLGNFTKVRPGVSDPSPPLILLATSPYKFYLGYLAQAKVVPERYNKWMLCTRAKAQCKFVVTPDYVFTTLEDVMRELYCITGSVV